MKAVRTHSYGPADNLTVDEIPVPEITDDQVLVKIHGASVNHIDFKRASGVMKNIFPVEFPWIPGADFAGTVTAVGKNVSGFKTGDEVYGDSPEGGAYAEYIVTTPAVIAKKPATLSFEEAASVPVAAQTAYQGVFDNGQLKKGQTILIHGAAGAVGAYAVQFARDAGAQVIATASGKDKAYLESIGAAQVIDYKAEDFSTIVKDADVVFDLVGGAVQQKSYGVLKAGGRLVTANQPPSQEEAKAHNVTAVMMNMQPSNASLTEIAALIDAGKIKADLSATFPLEKAAAAWNQVSQNLDGKGGSDKPKHPHGKVVLVP